MTDIGEGRASERDGRGEPVSQSGRHENRPTKTERWVDRVGGWANERDGDRREREGRFIERGASTIISSVRAAVPIHAH